MPVFSVGQQDRCLDERLFDDLDLLRRWHLGRAVHVQLRAVGQPGDVLDAGGGGDEGEVELPLQSLPDDVHVEKAEETTAKTETQAPPMSQAGRRPRSH